MLAYRHPRRRLGAAIAAVLALQLAACAGVQEKLYISSTTTLGLDASVNTARTAGHLQFGYDRYFVTWVPQTVRQEGDAHEVMSALNCTEVTVGNLTLKKFEESLATGVAATNFARQLAKDRGGDQYFECFTKDK
jgi:hypothetical protein